ncbi:MAG: SRPBCC family protein [bacterium]|nr:SRPBCC family protein [bacterium]
MQKSVTVNRPLEELYRFWREFGNLPRIMGYLDSVQVNGQRAHWKAHALKDQTVEWDTELVEDIPNERITWRSVEGAPLTHSGSVHFKPGREGWGNEVQLSLDIDVPNGKFGETAEKLLGIAPTLIAYKTLYAFKSLMETGEIPTLTGQPAARNGGRDE